MEINFDYQDGNGVTFVDMYLPSEEQGKTIGYIVNYDFYPTNPDILTDEVIMDIVYEELDRRKPSKRESDILTKFSDYYVELCITGAQTEKEKISARALKTLMPDVIKLFKKTIQ